MSDLPTPRTPRPSTMVPLHDLRASTKNARTHSKKQIGQIAKSIQRFGFTNPILVDDENVILAGHGRLEAAKSLGLTEAPCIRLSNLSEPERRAYVIADNKLALNAGWDFEILAGEFQGLLDVGFEVEFTGFAPPEIDHILEEQTESSVVASDTCDEIPSRPEPSRAVTQLGDRWVLGRHVLVCGDAKDSAALAALMWGEQADMIFTDSPYNVPVDGHVSGLGQVRHREFAEASGEMSSAQFREFLEITLGNAASVCRDGAIAFTCMDWRHLAELLDTGRSVFTELKNICVWAKTNGGMGTFYRSKHEMVLVWKVGTAPHTNTFGLGAGGRYRTNVWSYAGVNTFKADRMEELASHPTVKPVALVADAIRDVSHRGELVLDIFGGSGTTLIAAQKTGRRARLLEIDPTYCDLIVKRWEKLTGKRAQHCSGKTFEILESERRAPCQPTEQYPSIEKREY